MRNGILLIFFSILVSFSNGAYSVDIVSEFDRYSCQEFQLVKELRVYKDPSLFVGMLGQMYSDPHQGWKSLMDESPVLTALEGAVQLMKLGPPKELKHFGVISKFYEINEPKLKGPSTAARPKVIPVRICGPVYVDSLGFVLAADFEEALREDIIPGRLPPSVYPNPVPKLKNN